MEEEKCGLKRLTQTVKNQELMVAQVEKLTKENMMAQNEVTDIRKSSLGIPWMYCPSGSQS